jgi:hypothetical protein
MADMDDERRAVHVSRRSVIWAAVITVAFVVLWIWLGFVAAFFTALFLVALAVRLNPVIPLGLAIAFLIVCPFLLILNQNGASRVMAELSYYFLATGVFGIFVRYVLSQWRGDDGAAEPDVARERLTP